MRSGYKPIFFTEVDDSTDSSANENYGAEKKFVLAPASGLQYNINELIWTIGDDDSDYNKYGNLSALSTGIRLVLEDTDGVEIMDLLAGGSIKKTEDFLEYGFVVTPLNSGAGDTRITQATKQFDEGELIVRYGERLAWIIPAANFSTLEKHSLLAEVNRKLVY